MPDEALTSLPVVTAPALADPTYGVQSSTDYQYTMQLILGLLGRIPGGRLTLTSNTPVMAADVTATASVYYTPYNGDRIPIYNGSAWTIAAFTQLTMALDATNQTSGHLYDLFVWNNSGTIAIGAGPAWTSSTARGTGAGTTELQMLNGVWTNKNSITLKNSSGGGVSGIAANTATYVGTVYTTADGQTGMAMNPAAAAGGTNNFAAVYNAYNRIRIPISCTDSTSSAFFVNNSSWGPLNPGGTGSGLLNRISFIDGLQQSRIYVSAFVFSLYASGGNTGFGFDLDSTSATPVAFAQHTASGSVTTMDVNDFTFGSINPQLGFHYVQAMQIQFGSASTSQMQTNGANGQQYVLLIELEM